MVAALIKIWTTLDRSKELKFNLSLSEKCQNFLKRTVVCGGGCGGTFFLVQATSTVVIIKLTFKRQMVDVGKGLSRHIQVWFSWPSRRTEEKQKKFF